MTEFLPSKDIVKRWNAGVIDFGRLSDKTDVMIELAYLYDAQAKYAAEINTTIQYVDKTAFMEILKRVNTLKTGIRLVQDKKCGIRASGTNDFDIVAPAMYTKEEVDAMFGGTLDGWIIPVLIVAGVLAISYFRMEAARLETQVDEMNKKLAPVIHATDKTFCSDPDSEKCKRWLALKDQYNFDQRLSVTESIAEAIKGGAELIKKGASALSKGGPIGVALLIPLLGLFLWNKRKK